MAGSPASLRLGEGGRESSSPVPRVPSNPPGTFLLRGVLIPLSEKELVRLGGRGGPANGGAFFPASFLEKVRLVTPLRNGFLKTDTSPPRPAIARTHRLVRGRMQLEGDDPPEPFSGHD